MQLQQGYTYAYVYRRSRATYGGVLIATAVRRITRVKLS